MPDHDGAAARQPDPSGVCVIIAAWNAAGTIARAIQSALREPEVVEVVVVDDGSNDGTAQVALAAAAGSSRLTLIRQVHNRGPAAARNLAMARSRAPLLCVLDADDHFIPGRIRRLLDAGSNRWDLLADDIVIVPEHWDGPLPHPSAAGPRRTLDIKAFVHGNLRSPRGRRQELGFLKPLMRRSFLERVGLRYEESLRLAEDYALYVEALACGAVFELAPPCGYVALERATSLSGRHATADLAAIAAFDERMLMRGDRLGTAERAALEAHRAETLARWRYRRVLDRRRVDGYGAALIELMRMPRAWSHILGATLRAKAEVLQARRPAGSTSPRLLVGDAGP